MSSTQHDPEQTAPLDPPSEPSFADGFFAHVGSRFTVETAGASHVGHVRQSNEDAFGIVRRTRSHRVLATNLPRASWPDHDDHAYVLVVADGVGGQAFGHFASQLALETAFELAGAATSWVMKLTTLDAEKMRLRIDAYCQQIQATLRRYGDASPELQGMATTWTAAYVIPPHAVVMHIGDSRAYRFRDDSLWQITEDQTMAQQLTEAGMPADVVAQFRHVLTNCLGAHQRHVSAKVYQADLQAGDRLLLCTDGLSDMVDEGAIRDVLAAEREPQAACDRLVQSALDNGGKDNVTVIVGDIGKVSHDA